MIRRQKAYDTRYSQPVTHASTNRARHCLTSEIECIQLGMVVGDKVVVYSAICISQLLENRAKSNETATKSLRHSVFPAGHPCKY